jgi:hypothetical protein
VNGQCQHQYLLQPPSLAVVAGLARFGCMSTAAVTQGKHGSTTVSATMILAARAGITVSSLIDIMSKRFVMLHTNRCPPPLIVQEEVLQHTVY